MCQSREQGQPRTSFPLRVFGFSSLRNGVLGSRAVFLHTPTHPFCQLLRLVHFGGHVQQLRVKDPLMESPVVEKNLPTKKVDMI